jgi:amino-acid N-acetyltransferase
MRPLRRAQTSDLPVVLDLLRTNGLPYQDITANHLDDFLIADGGEAVTGIVGLERHGNDALLRSLAVRENGRGTGLGTQLMIAIEAQAVRSGITGLYLLTTTAADFFARRGYATIDRAAAPAALRQSTEFSGLCPSQAVCMHKSFAPLTPLTTRTP